MHPFSNLFDKVIYMTVPVYSVYSGEILLMMDSGPV
jgi:hypothetical protein